MTLPSGRPASSFDDVRSPTLDEWEAWVLHVELRLWQAVALASEIEPSSLPAEGLWAHAPEGSLCKRYHGRYQAALSAVSAGVLKVRAPSQFMSSWTVAVGDFVEWARSVGLELSPVIDLAASRHVAPQHSSVGGRWPWGNHETELLRFLEKAAVKFWVNFDPDDPTTKVNSDVVEAWLKSQKLSDGREFPVRVAEVIAQMLRPRELKVGRQRKK